MSNIFRWCASVKYLRLISWNELRSKSGAAVAVCKGVEHHLLLLAMTVPLKIEASLTFHSGNNRVINMTMISRSSFGLYVHHHKCAFVDQQGPMIIFSSYSVDDQAGGICQRAWANNWEGRWRWILTGETGDPIMIKYLSFMTIFFAEFSSVIGWNVLQ